MSAPGIGFIGLGRMGRPMAQNLAKAGYAVHVFDVDAGATRKAAEGHGLSVHDSRGSVAGAVEVLFTALPDDRVVTETYLGRDGILASARSGLTTCDCSTVSPEVSAKIYAAAKTRGVAHMDTPMLGSSPQAEAGEIFFIVGGDEDRVPAIRPMLDVMGRLNMYVGPAGTGNRIKLLHNALAAVNAVAVAESLTLCRELGVDPKTYYEVVRQGGGMAYSTYFDRRVMRMVEGNFSPTFTLDLMVKDVRLASQMAGPHAPHLKVLREALAAFSEAQQAGWGGEDFSAVLHLIEQRLEASGA